VTVTGTFPDTGLHWQDLFYSTNAKG